MAEEGTVLDFGPPQEVPDDVPPRKSYVCEVCGTELEYGGRGRPPTRCDEHKKGAGGPPGTSRPPGGSPRRVTGRADREAKELAARVDKQLVKASLLIAPFDVYDGTTIYAMRGPVVEQFEGVMRDHDQWRAAILQAQGTSSVAGLVVACLAMAAPMLAHHGLIPNKVGAFPIGEALVQLPKITARLQRAAESGEQVMADYMARMAQEEAERKQAKEAASRQGPVNPSEPA